MCQFFISCIIIRLTYYIYKLILFLLLTDKITPLEYKRKNMTKKLLVSVFALSLSITAFAYDKTKADSMNKFYSNFTQKACANSKLFISAKDTFKMLKEKKKFTLLDVRTTGENSVVSVSLEGSLYIPLKDLFKKENLDKLPSEGTIIIVCHSGTRATLAAIGLKQIGIKNTRILKGGFVALADANNPKNAPMK